jgi:hypothetical protein
MAAKNASMEPVLTTLGRSLRTVCDRRASWKLMNTAVRTETVQNVTISRDQPWNVCSSWTSRSRKSRDCGVVAGIFGSVQQVVGGKGNLVQIRRDDVDAFLLHGFHVEVVRVTKETTLRRNRLSLMYCTRSGLDLSRNDGENFPSMLPQHRNRLARGSDEFLGPEGEGVADVRKILAQVNAAGDRGICAFFR